MGSKLVFAIVSTIVIILFVQPSEAKWPNYPLNHTIHDCWQCMTFSSNWKEEKCTEKHDKFTCRDGTLACMKTVRPLPMFDNEVLGLKNIVIRACYPANEWQIKPLGKNEEPHTKDHTHNVIFSEPRVTTKALCKDLIEAHISRYSWLAEFYTKPEYRNIKIQGAYANVTREEAIQKIQDWEDLCENMEDEDITEENGLESKQVLRCITDMCNSAVNNNLWAPLIVTLSAAIHFLSLSR